MASFPDPHHPFTPPGRYWSMYRPQDMALPRELPPRQPAVGAIGRLGAGAARERQGRRHRAGRLRGRRARGTRGDGAELRHDRDDRRCRRPRPRRARRARAGRGHDRDLHHRPRRLSRRSSSHAERAGAFRWDHPRAVHLGRAGHAAGAPNPTFSAARSISHRPFSIAPASSPTTASRARACCRRSPGRAPTREFDGDRGRPAARRSRLCRRRRACARW